MAKYLTSVTAAEGYLLPPGHARLSSKRRGAPVLYSKAISKTLSASILSPMRTSEITNEQWERLEPLLPPRRMRGRPRADDRRTLNGILYVLRTGCCWEDVPREYGSSTTCWRKLRAWEEMVPGKAFGVVCWPCWTSRRSLSGPRRSWMLASSLPKRGNLRRQDQARQG